MLVRGRSPASDLPREKALSTCGGTHCEIAAARSLNTMSNALSEKGNFSHSARPTVLNPYASRATLKSVSDMSATVTLQGLSPKADAI